jgi:ribonuclease G
MQSAFVAVGIEKDVYLYVGDREGVKQFNEEEEEELDLSSISIRDYLKQGQEIVIQILKEPIGTKGARGTTYITLPGRYLVLMPSVSHVGVSKRIEVEEERERLRTIGEEIVPEGMGLIIRTVAEGKSKEVLEKDLNFLVELWKKVKQGIETAPPYTMIYKDLDIVLKLARDLYTEDIDELVIDNEEAYNKILDFFNFISEDISNKIVKYEGYKPIFEYYGIESEIEKALRRKIWLKCGGYLIIEQTEALTSIDVNTGKFVGSSSLEETVFRANMDAAEEIARQVRLRDIGGIIIIDFIDMTEEEHKIKIQEVLERAFQKDKTKTKIFPINELGLLQMTRKRVKKGLEGVLKDNCPYCHGEGKILSFFLLGNKAKQKIVHYSKNYHGKLIRIKAHPKIADYLLGEDEENRINLEKKTGKNISIILSDELHVSEIIIHDKKLRLTVYN